MNDGDEMTTTTRSDEPLLDAIGPAPSTLPPRIVVAGPEAASAPGPTGTPKVAAENVNIYYGTKLAVRDVTLQVPERSILALIGPSCSG
jgi:ABC-type multidrug transport system fused ATPase/permease subunit